MATAGLNTNFSLSNGAVTLTSGPDRAADRVWMLANFDGFRIYATDYNPGFVRLQQKNASYLIQYRTLILQTLSNLLAKYVTEITVTSLDIIYTVKNRREYGILIAYTYLAESTGISVVFLG